MMQRILTIIVASYFIQVTSGDFVAELIKELQPKMQRASRRVADVTLQGGNSVRNSFVQIQKSMNVYTEELNKERMQLIQDVVEARIDALRDGRNIDTCVQKVFRSAEKLAGWQFEKCRLSPKLKSLSNELANLAREEGKIIMAPVKCSFEAGGDFSEIKTCVLDIVEGAKELANSVEDDIELINSQAIANAKKCGEERSEELKDQVKSVSEKFEDCVSEKMS